MTEGGRTERMQRVTGKAVASFRPGMRGGIAPELLDDLGSAEPGAGTIDPLLVQAQGHRTGHMRGRHART